MSGDTLPIDGPDLREGLPKRRIGHWLEWRVSENFAMNDPNVPNE